MVYYMQVSICMDGNLRDFTLCLLGNFACFLSSADFFQNKKKFSNTIVCQTVWI